VSTILRAIPPIAHHARSPADSIKSRNPRSSAFISGQYCLFLRPFERKPDIIFAMPRLPFAILLTALLPLAAAIPGPVRVEQGQLSGVPGSDPDVRVYKGIPFAAPPTGDLRWRAPKPAADWPGVRKADQFSSTCMQTPYAEGSLYRSEPQPVSEDCLYLNIWTAAKSASDKRPVMVWIHGGAFTRGSGSMPTYNGENFAKKGVVLVTVNYRLGIFGFFAHPELTQESEHHSSGNYGILDEIAALQWVQKNIAAFGGDPKRVTIFGESAGSWAVNLLVASPLAKGLFQRAIGESGANFNKMTPLADLEKSGLRVGSSIQDLRAKSAEDMLKTLGAFSVNVDGWLLPTDVMTIFEKGRQNDVPILIGSNADEGTAFMPPKITVAGFQTTAQSRFKDHADELLKIYPATSDAEAWKASAALMRDQTFGLQMRTWARMQTKTGKSPAYLYYFSRVPPGPVGEHYGAFHASEISYVFGTEDIGKRTWESADRKLSYIMSSYWINFAATGNPNGRDRPSWPKYDENKDLALGLGDEIRPIPVPNKAGLDFLAESR
jgi:para-nitrobenzyl esterase